VTLMLIPKKDWCGEVSPVGMERGGARGF